MSEMKSVIIIGAGLAGLSAGCYVQMNGYTSHIFEHHAIPGGVATGWKRKGFTIDGGIHFLMGHKPGQPSYEMLLELGTAQNNNFIDMDIYGRFIDEKSGYSVDIVRDFESFAKQLSAISSEDMEWINDFVRNVEIFRDPSLSSMDLGKPPELTSIRDQVKQMWDMRKTMKYFMGQYKTSAAEYAVNFHSPVLRGIFENLFLPESPMWFVYMVMGLFASGGLGLIEKGSLGFVLPIAKRYAELGGTATYNATVDEILVEEDRAVGVLLADGSTHYADVIVSAADGYSTIFKMLGGRYVNNFIRQQYSTWKLIRPFVMVNFGVNRQFTDHPWLQFVQLEDPIVFGNQTVPIFMIRTFNYSGGFAAPGKTVVQVTFDTDWNFWNDLQRDRPKYDDEKQNVANQVRARLEKYYPGISSQIEMTDVLTPYTTWRYTLNHKGAYEGWLPTHKVLMSRVKRTLPGLSNFYMAGQWVLPGGGVIPCLYSGRHVAERLCSRDKKRFETKQP